MPTLDSPADVVVDSSAEPFTWATAWIVDTTGDVAVEFNDIVAATSPIFVGATASVDTASPAMPGNGGWLVDGVGWAIPSAGVDVYARVNLYLSWVHASTGTTIATQFGDISFVTDVDFPLDPGLTIDVDVDQSPWEWSIDHVYLKIEETPDVSVEQGQILLSGQIPQINFYPNSAQVLTALEPDVLWKVEEPTVWELTTAMVDVEANFFILSRPGGTPGESITEAIPIHFPEFDENMTITRRVDLTTMFKDVWEPESTKVHTAWFAVTTARPIDFYVSPNGVNPIQTDVFDDEYEDTGIDPTTVFRISNTDPVFVRLSNDEGGEFVVDFVGARNVYEGTVLARDVDQTPGTVTVTGTNFDANDTAEISIFGVTSLTTTSNGSGEIGPLAVYLPAVASGPYVAQIETSNTVGSDSFMVVNDPLSTNPDPIDMPVSVPEGVDWMLVDPYVGGRADYVFPINPREMTTPYVPKAAIANPTLAGDSLVFQGAQPAARWSFRGYLETQEFHDELAAWAKLGRRFLIRDHRGRWWITTFVTFEPSPVRNLRDGGVLWFHDYQVQALIWGRYEG